MKNRKEKSTSEMSENALEFGFDVVTARDELALNFSRQHDCALTVEQHRV